MRNKEMSNSAKIAVIGNGVIGSAIARLHKSARVFGREDNLDNIGEFDVVIVAVKPQQFKQLASQLRGPLSDQMIVSVMAGIRINTIQDLLGVADVARTMPNLGIGSGQSLTGIFPATESLKHIVSMWGDVIELNAESDFDAFTALAGSSPALLYRLVSQIKFEALSAGFSEEVSLQIATGVMHSSAAALGKSDPEKKVLAVASKGGTTEAALQILDSNKFNQIVGQAINAAETRSKELSK